MSHIPEDIKQSVFSSKMPSALFERIVLPGKVSALKGDIFLSPYYKCPPNIKIPSIITIHDIIPLFTTGLLYRTYFKNLLQQSLKGTTTSIVVSSYVKNDILNYFGKQTIGIVSNCVGPGFSPEKTLTEDSIIKSYGLTPNKYILYVGNNNPHKKFICLKTHQVC